MNKNKHDDYFFRTSSFNIASFLYVKSFDLVSVDDTSNPRRKEFVFRDTPEREGLVNSFNFAPVNDSQVIVDARELIHAIKTLKDKVHQ